MAKLSEKSLTPKITATTDEGRLAQEQEQLDALYATANALPHGELKGALIEFTVGDGVAIYRIAKANPLTLEHVNFFDGYKLMDFMIRGLRRYEVERLVQVQRQYRELFPVEA